MYPAYPAGLNAQPVVPWHRHALGSSESYPVSPIPDLNPQSGPFGLSVWQKVLVPHLQTDASSSGQC